MSRMRIVLGLMLGAALVAGACDREDKPSSSPTPKPPTPDVTPKAGAAAALANGAASAGATASATRSPTTGATTAPATTRAAAAAAKAPADDGAAVPLVSVTPPGADKMKQAQELVGQAMQALKENRPAEARTALDKLDALGDGALQPTTREQVITLRRNLESVERLQKTDLPLPADFDNK